MFSLVVTNSFFAFGEKGSDCGITTIVHSLRAKGIDGCGNML